MKALLNLACLIFLLCGCTPPEAEPPTPFGPVPTPAQLAWHRMEMNAFLHFTTNTFTDKEWGYGDESPQIFNPSELDTEQWITTLKAAGMEGAILTCKHHDGFALWPSEYTEHDVENAAWESGTGDLVGAVESACRANGMKFGVYLSPWDRNHPDYGKPAYVDYYRNQLTELYENYGPIFEMWFDGANGGDGYYGGADEKRSIDGRTYYDWPTTIELVRKLQPDPHVIVFSDAGPDIRWVGNERGVAGPTNWNTITKDTLYAGQPGITDLLNSGTAGGTSWLPAEVDVSIRPGWFYHAAEDSLVKTPEQLFEIYLTSVGRGSNLLLNVPPDRRGLIHENDVASLEGWRKLLDEAFAEDLAAGATVTATATRGEGERFAPATVTDDNRETYWATDDGITTSELIIDLGEAQPVKFVELAEYIQLGQRISAFSLEAEVDGKWQPIGEGSTVGYKRIVPTEAVTASKIRINIEEALASPTLHTVAVW